MVEDLRSLLASQDIRDAVRHRRYGVVLRRARQARGLTQAQAGELAGYSAATISRFETGNRRLADIDTLRRISAALGITPELFGLTPGIGDFLRVTRAAPVPDSTALATVVTGPPQDGDEVRRRELLAGLAGVSAAAILPVSRPAVGTGPDPLTATLAELLGADPGAADPVPTTKLRSSLAAAWQDFNFCRYQALAGKLPALLATACATSAYAAAGAARTEGSAALASTYILMSELAQKAGSDGMSWVSADRSMTAARDSGEPATIAASSRAVAMAMRRLGHYDAATTMLTRTALSLGADHGDPPTPVLAAYGSLLCTAAYASAQNGRRQQSLDFITEAAVAAERMQGTPADWRAFSVAVVEGYQISIHNALGDSAAALTHARAVVQSQLPTAERHARFCIDTARAWHQHGRPDQAYRALLAAERQAPEEIRRSSVRTLITTLVQGPGPRPYGLRQLAERSGALT